MSDPCIYMSGEEDPFYIGVYVDYMVLAGKDKTKISEVTKETYMGRPSYTEKLLTKMGMSDCKLVKTPVDPGTHT